MIADAERDGMIRAWYQQYRHDIYRFARYTLGPSTEAYDVVQETFLRAIRSWRHYRQDASPKTWLLTIARNYMRDVRKKKFRERRALDSFQETQVLAHEDTSPEQRYRQLVLEQSLRELKSSYRQVFVLRHIEELSVQDTAHVLGWSESKVTTTDHRAIAKLRQVLAVAEKGVDDA